jgi:hypothetical protein
MRSIRKYAFAQHCTYSSWTHVFCMKRSEWLNEWLRLCGNGVSQELLIIDASALEFNNTKQGSFKHGNTVLCCQMSVYCKKCLGWQLSKVEANTLT